MKSQAFTTLQSAWQQRPPRERRLVWLAAIVIGAAWLWSWALGPALATWRQAPLKQAELDQKTRQMQALQAEARQLQAPVRLQRQPALDLLERLGKEWLGEGAQLELRGEQLKVLLKATPASGLARWLEQAREQAQALPQAARLQRVPDTGQDEDAVFWSGELTLRLP